MTVWKGKTCARNATTRATQGAARGLMTGREDGMRRSLEVRMKCNKDCIANVCGECAVEKCEGQIQKLGIRNNNAETAAWTYKIAVDSFKDYFGKKDADQ
jgi:hypothetical protein